MIKRENLDFGIKQIGKELAKMSVLVQKAIMEVTSGLVNRNEEFIHSAIAKEESLDALELEIERLSITTIALNQPVSRDLRFLISALFISSDMERIGDLVLNIGKASQDVIAKPPLKPFIDIPRMSETCLQMIEELTTALIQHDILLAKSASKRDTLVDTLYYKIWRELLSYMVEDAKTIEVAETILHIAKQYERIGDHLTNMAERICYVETGTLPDLNE